MIEQRTEVPAVLKTLADLTVSLGQASPAEFPRDWLRRAFSAEFARLTIEDAYADPTSEPYEQAQAALETLLDTEDWLTPRLQEFLTACYALGVAPEPKRSEVETQITVDGRKIRLLEWQPETELPMTVSSAYSHAVQVIERSLAHPRYCHQLLDAFASRVKLIQEKFAADGLLFIEKEAGPVGALAMLSSLVNETDLPASIYRETRWAEHNSVTGFVPKANNRLVIIYDLIVTGAGVVRAAEKIDAMTGAQCVGAVVLRGYGPRRATLRTSKNQPIHVKALNWDTRTLSGESLAFERAIERADNVRGSPTRSKETPMILKTSGGIPPGSYTRDTLPELSEGARKILDRIRRETPEPDISADSAGRIVRKRPGEKVAGLRPTEKLASSLQRIATENSPSSQSQQVA